MATARFKRIGLITAGVIGVLLIAGVLAAWLFLRAGFPDYDGELSAQGLTEEVVIERDDRGVAYIDAQNEDDLFFAQGYAHAQERLWQMDFHRRVVQGRLSEAFGEEQLNADRFLRTIGLQRIAERLLEHTSDEGLHVLQQYAQGVNAYMEDAGTLPLEFRVLGITPEPWEPVHSTALTALMAYNLGDNWRAEAFRARLQNTLDETLFQDILPPYDVHTRPVLTGDHQAAMQRLLEKSQLNGIAHHLPSLGSNSWVVAPERSESGNALLGNDPHLTLSMPVLWYENYLSTPDDLDVYGWSIAGGPGVVIGHNESIAWGFTNTGDTQDLFLEEADPRDPDRFRIGEDWHDAEIIEEQIFVDGRDEPDTHQVRITQNGPIVNNSPTLSLRWTAYEVEASAVDALLQINRASDWDSFRAGLEHFTLPAQNVVYADTEGNIGFRTVGDIPQRGAGEGLMPQPGDDEDAGWQGMIPFDEMPEMLNPPEGFIATANHRVEDADFPHVISREYAGHYRMQRIVDVLEANDSVSIQDMAALQNDWFNMLAYERLPEFIEAVEGAEDAMTSAEQEVLAMLRTWADDPINRQDEPAAAFFQTWYVEIIDEIFRPQLGEQMYQEFLDVSMYPVYNATTNILNQDETPWLPDGREPMLRTTFTRSVQQLQDELGRNPENWRWDELQAVYLEHAIGESPVMRPLVNRGPYPYGGDHVTVGRAGYRLTNPFKVVHGAGLRFLADMNNPVDAQAILAGGQSGHPWHRHYDDQVDLWLQGEYVQISPDREEPHTLRLIPE